jgi:hypothetical protein
LRPFDSDILSNQGHLYDHLSFSEIGIQQIGWPTSAFPRIQSALFHIRTYALVVVACTCFTGYVSLDCELVDCCKYLVDNCLFRHFGGLWYFVMGVQQIIMAKKEFLEE